MTIRLQWTILTLAIAATLAAHATVTCFAPSHEVVNGTTWYWTGDANTSIVGSFYSVGQSFSNVKGVHCCGVPASTSGSLTIPDKLGGDSVIAVSQGDINNQWNEYVESFTPYVSLGVIRFGFGERITSISIPASVSYIGNDTFDVSKNLASITVSSANRYYSSQNGLLLDKKGTYLLRVPPGKKGVVIPNSVTKTHRSAFANSSCENLTIPAGLEYNPGGESYFWRFDVTSLVVTSGSGSILPYSFSGMSSLTSVTISEGVTSIGSAAFNGCRSINQIALPSSLASIGAESFCNCSGLSSFSIPKNVTSIGKDAFKGCNFEYLTIQGKMLFPLSDLANAFGGTPIPPIRISPDITEIEDRAFENCADLVEITIPDCVTSIGNYAFAGCSNLCNVSIPSSVSHIGAHTFDDCKNVIFDDVGKPYLKILDGWLLDVDPSCPSSMALSGIHGIADYAVADCPRLESVTIPNGVTIISDGAFSGCINLSSIVIPGSVTSIGRRAFEGCPRLGTFTIPSAVTSIGLGAFAGCDLEAIVLPGMMAFPLHSLKEVFAGEIMPDLRIASGVAKIADNTFKDCDVVSVTIPESVTTIGNYAFANFSCSMPFSIPDSVATISNFAFSGFKKEELTIPQTVQSIGDNAFKDAKISLLLLPEKLRGCSSKYAIPSVCTVVFYKVFNSDVEIGKEVIWNASTGESWVSCGAGTHMLRSGEIPASGASAAKATIIGPGTLSFDWRISAGRGDYGKFLLDGNLKQSITRQTEWATITMDIPSGIHTLEWAFERGSGSASNEDACFLRNLSWRPLKNLSVSSELGVANPNGLSSKYWGDVVSASVAEPEPIDGVQFVCTGWEGAGSVPSSGNGGRVEFKIFEDSSLTWQWQTNVWVDFAITGGTSDFSPQWVRKGDEVIVGIIPDYRSYNISFGGDTEGIVYENGKLRFKADAPKAIEVSVTEKKLNLTIRTEHGAAKPSPGTHSYSWGDKVAISVEPPDPADGFRYVCSGWKGTGSIPSEGSGSYVSCFIEKDSSITWLWRTNVWIEIQAEGMVSAGFTNDWLELGSPLIFPIGAKAEYVEVIAESSADGGQTWTHEFMESTPGLVQAKFNSRFDTASTASNASEANVAIVSGAIAAYAKCNSSPWRFTDPLSRKTYAWNSENTTFAYFGQMWLEGGRTYVFGSHFDDDTFVKVDGQTLINVKSSSGDRVYTGRYECTKSGWYDVEFRLSDATGGKGSWGSVWGENFGLGYRDDGLANTEQGAWKPLLDPGDGSLFRCRGTDAAWLWGDDNALTFSVRADQPKIIRIVGREHTLEDALDAAGIEWSTGGDAEWMPSGDSYAYTCDGKSFSGEVAQSGMVTGDGVSVLEATVGASGFLYWNWKIDRLGNAGVDVFVDGEWQQTYSPTEEWTRESLGIVGEGEHTVRFEFWNAGTAATLDDCAFIDQVALADSRLIFNANGGKGAMASFGLFSGAEQTLPECTFTKDGHFFLGWALTPSGEATLLDCDSTANIIVAQGETVTLYAVWHEGTGKCMDGLVAWYQFDGDAVDSSMNGNNGNVSGATLAADRNGNANSAYYFDGNDRIVVPENASISGILGEFSIVSWLKYERDHGGWIPVVCKGSARQFGLCLNTNGGTDIGPGQANFATMPEKGGWAHVAVTFNSNHVSSAYVNGVLVGTSQVGNEVSQSPGDLIIGVDPPGSTEYLYGSLDDLSIWNRALSAEEIGRLYVNGRLGYAYSIRFVANGGEGLMRKRIYAGGEDVELPASMFTREGMTFAGWSLEPDGPIAYADGEVISGGVNAAAEETITLFAQWSTGRYMVAFDANGGEGAMAVVHPYSNVKCLLPECTFTKDGHYFFGWALTPDGDAVLLDGDNVDEIGAAPNETVALYAVWHEEANGGNGLSVKYYDISSSGYPTWSESEAALINYFADKIPTIEACTADWGENLDAGFSPVYTGTDASRIAEIGSSSMSTNRFHGKYSQSPQPYIEMYLFGHIYAEKDGNYSFRALADDYFAIFVDGVRVCRGSWNNICAGSITLEKGWHTLSIGFNQGQGGKGFAAQWKKPGDSSYTPIPQSVLSRGHTSTYAVRLDANGGEGTMQKRVYAVGDDVTLPANAFTREGALFGGWGTSPDGPAVYGDGEKINGGFGTEGGETTTLYAIWLTDLYSVHFDANGGDGSMVDEQFWIGLPDRLSQNTFRRTGYSFKGWSRSKNGAVEFADKALVANLTEEANATVTLYAVWSPNQYQVYFNGGGASGEMLNQQFTYDVAAPLSANAFSRIGYAFAGWATTTNGGKVYDDCEVVSNLSSVANAVVNLYPTWTANSYSVRFDANGGNGTMAEQPFTYDAPQMLSRNTFTYANRLFVGWTMTPDGAVAYDDGKQVSNLSAQDGDQVTLYAVWADGRIVFDASGGDGEMPPFPLSAGKTQTLPQNTFTKAGHFLLGWALTPNGEATLFDGDSTANIEVAAGETVTLYAVWHEGVGGGGSGYTGSGPVAAYSFDGDFADVSGNGHDLESGGIGFSEDRFGKSSHALLFDGRECPAGTTSLELWSSFSVSCWFKTDVSKNNSGWHANSYGNYPLYPPCTESPGAGVGFKVGTDGLAVVEHGPSYQPEKLTYNANVGNGWNQVCMVVENDMTVRLYLNGKLVSSGTLSSRRKRLTVECVGGCAWGCYTGAIDDLLVYNRAISDAEVAQLYEVSANYAAPYAVRFDANGGDGEMLKRVYAAGDDVTLPANAFARENWVFAGWALEPDGEIVWRDGETVSGGFEVEANETITLYARWSRGLYTVRFNANGGNGEMPDMTMPLDYPIALPSNAFTRTGYTFQGWAETSEGNVAYADKARVTNLANTSGQTATLYAKWAVNTYMVTLDRQGGSGGTASVTATYGSAMPAISVPTKTNLRFKGYFTGANGTGTQYYTASGTSARAWDSTTVTTLYACWRENQAPAFTTVTPNVDFIGMEIGATETFTVAATDADGDSLTTTWYLCDKTDGADIFVGSCSSFAFTPTRSGDYRVKAEVSDGRTAISTLWDVKVFPANVADYGEIPGSDLIWFVAGTTLTICGNGPMPSYANADPPYQGYAETITRIVIEEGVTEVGDNAFQDFQNVTTVSLPETLTSIGIGAFADCASLDNVVIPDSVETLGEGAFSGCDSLGMLYLPQRFVPYIDDLDIPDTCSVANTDVYRFVRRLYNLCLNREPDMSGCAHWSTLLTSGARNGVSVAYGFCFSAEMKRRNLSDGDFVEILYNALMGRHSDSSGKAHWVDLLSKGISRVGVFRGFAESAEFSRICNSYGITRGNVDAKLLEERDKNRGVTMFVARCYTKALNRNYDVNGLNHWCAKINSASAKKAMAIQVSRSFLTSAEFQRRKLSNDAFVEVLYQTFLDRKSDAAGKKHWLDKMKAGANRDSIMASFYNSAEFNKIMAGYGIR